MAFAIPGLRRILQTLMLHKSEYQESGAGRVVPVRVRSRVVPVAVEGAIIRAIVRVAADTEHAEIKRESGAICLCKPIKIRRCGLRPASVSAAKSVCYVMSRGTAVPLDNPPQGELRTGRAAKSQIEYEAAMDQ